MSDASSQELLSRLLQDAYAGQPVPEGPHVMEDDDLLARWSQDVLSSEERSRIIDHLAVCPECRDDLTAMVNTGVLQLPNPDESEQRRSGCESETGKEERVQSSRSASSWLRQPRIWLGAALAAAACLLIYFGFFRPGEETPADRLAKAEEQWQAGNAEASYKLSLALWQDELSGTVRDKTRGLLANSSYQVAREALRRRQYDRVREIGEEISGSIGPQPRIERLTLQAERKIPWEYTLAMADAALLTHHNYDLNGMPQPTKAALPVFTEADQAERERFRSAIEHYPEDAGLRVNFAALLLEQGKYRDAKSQFEKAVELDGENPFAWLGLGLATFELANNGAADFKDARDAFATALKLDADSLAAQMNLAICLERMGDDGSKAAEHWKRALDLAKDPALKAWIRLHLSE